MQPFEHNGKRVEFSAVSGVVVGPHKHAETHVSGGGGGGSTFNGQGSTAPVHITSTVVIKQDFFVRDDKGQETPVQLRGVDIPLAEGQRVTMITSHSSKGGWWTHVVNHSAQRYWRVTQAKDLVINSGVVNPLMSFLIGMAIWIGIGYAISGLLGFIATVAYWVYAWLDVRRVAKAMESHLEEIAGKALRSGSAGSEAAATL